MASPSREDADTSLWLSELRSELSDHVVAMRHISVCQVCGQPSELKTCEACWTYKAVRFKDMMVPDDPNKAVMPEHSGSLREIARLAYGDSRLADLLEEKLHIDDSLREQW